MKELFYYKLIIAYDGTNFLGWQEQAKGRTVQGTLKAVFQNLFSKNCSIVGASRTDTGVHAECQVARINAKLNITPEKLLFSWGNSMPADIAIKSIELLEDPSDFHPQHNIIEKTYHYDFYVGQTDPFLNRTTLHWNWKVDISKLEQALQLFVGTKDFRSFCSTEVTQATTRTINSIALKKIKDKNNNELYRIEIKGKSFLHNMIRRIVGACLEVNRKQLDISVLQTALDSKNPEQALLNAPAHGLTLHKIEYEK